MKQTKRRAKRTNTLQRCNILFRLLTMLGFLFQINTKQGLNSDICQLEALCDIEWCSSLCWTGVRSQAKCETNCQKVKLGSSSGTREVWGVCHCSVYLLTFVLNLVGGLGRLVLDVLYHVIDFGFILEEKGANDAGVNQNGAVGGSWSHTPHQESTLGKKSESSVIITGRGKCSNQQAVSVSPSSAQTEFSGTCLWAVVLRVVLLRGDTVCSVVPSNSYHGECFIYIVDKSKHIVQVIM